MARKIKGRRKGSRNKGYFWRSTHRAWYASAKGKMFPLTDERGNRFRDEDTSEAVLKEAHARFIVNLPKQEAAAEQVTVHDLAQAYLDNIKQTKGAAATYEYRAPILFDFCSGFGRRWYKRPRDAKAKDRIHEGHGNMAAGDLRPFHIYAWLSKHPGWGSGSNRMAIQTVRRMLCFGKECGLLTENPIRGIKIPRGQPRITCLSPEQEKALLAVSRKQLRTAIQVLIRTGMRPGEFAKLTATHVVDHGDKMELRLKAGEVKTRQARTVRITDSATIDHVRYGIKHHKTGPIFRTVDDKPWEVKNLSRSFFRAMKRAEKRHKVKFDADCVLYSTRHTFAKRILTGYWSGKPVNIELLAKLMGNSPKVCRDNYLQWSESYEQPLWDAVG